MSKFPTLKHLLEAPVMKTKAPSMTPAAIELKRALDDEQKASMAAELQRARDGNHPIFKVSSPILDTLTPDVIKWLEKNAPKQWKRIQATGRGSFYRGHSSGRKEHAAIVEPRDTRRHSQYADGGNLRIVFHDAAFPDSPPRSMSTICTMNHMTALSFGPVSIIVPADKQLVATMKKDFNLDAAVEHLIMGGWLDAVHTIGAAISGHVDDETRDRVIEMTSIMWGAMTKAEPTLELVDWVDRKFINMMISDVPEKARLRALQLAHAQLDSTLGPHPHLSRLSAALHGKQVPKLSAWIIEQMKEKCAPVVKPAIKIANGFDRPEECWFRGPYVIIPATEPNY